MCFVFSIQFPALFEATNVFFPFLHFHFYFHITATSYVVGPCHHGMACPQVADRGTASDKKGSCE